MRSGGELPGVWAVEGTCSTVGDPDSWFVSGAGQHAAVPICLACPVRLDCLAFALDNREVWGVWGGMTERARRKLLREFPDVEAWRSLLSLDR